VEPPGNDSLIEDITVRIDLCDGNGSVGHWVSGSWVVSQIGHHFRMCHTGPMLLNSKQWWTFY